jgi:eukaryotic-like serine/threonine-protein kinase
VSDSAQDNDAPRGAQPSRRGDTEPALGSRPGAPGDAAASQPEPPIAPSERDAKPRDSSSDVQRGGAAADPELDQLEPTSEARNRALIGSVLVGRYRIDELLGSGGMGSVYRAEHVHMRKAVAIKVLHREMTYMPEVVARFEREAVAAGRIDHPNVAAATDFGRLADGAFYLVLEYVEGRSLRALMKERGKLEAPEALHVARQIAEALGAAHAAGIVHRDLKPENVMLVEREGDPTFVKVLDFGIAKVSLEDTGNQPALTQVGSVFGTPEYMSPEQASGVAVDSRSDLYTVGLLLYEMLSGSSPFADDDLVVVLTRQMTMDPPPLPESVPPGAVALVMSLLAKDPDQRIASAEQLIERIDTLGLIPFMPPSLGSLSSGRHAPLSVAAASSRLAPPSAAATAVPANAVSERLRVGFDRALLAGRQTVRIGGQPFAVWMLAALGGGVVLFVVTVVVLVHGASHSATREDAPSASAAVAVAPPPALSAMMARAASGDRDAIAALRKRPDATRSALEWRALGRGYAKLEMFSASVAAYARAAALDPKLASDRILLDDVRRAALRSNSDDAALKLCAGGLGSSGIDLLYDLSTSSERADRAVTERAKKLLDEDAVRARASPALAVVLDLKHARGCSAYKKILPDAASNADARSLTTLRRLTASRGCGFLGLGDCFSCLRGDPALSDAIHRAEAHPAPEF